MGAVGSAFDKHRRHETGSDPLAESPGGGLTVRGAVRLDRGHQADRVAFLQGLPARCSFYAMLPRGLSSSDERGVENDRRSQAENGLSGITTAA
jgi:hypothetical protein